MFSVRKWRSKQPQQPPLIDKALFKLSALSQRVNLFNQCIIYLHNIYSDLWQT